MDKIFDNEAVVLRTQIELQALITEREGMIAENMKREWRRESMAYGEEAFQAIADEMRALKEAPCDERG